jgi:hypothetical protein
VLVGGKPSAETMAIKRVDDRHVITIVKMNGKAFGTSKATLSADANTITVENEYAMGGAGQGAGQPPTKSTEIWIRK